MVDAPPLSSTTTPSVPTAGMMEDKALVFAPFPRLPIELRLKIWECFNQSGPRDVEVKILPPALDDLTRSVPKFQSLTPIPTILHICRDARQVGLKTYEKVFKARDKDGQEEDSIYINPHLDVLVIRIPEFHRDWYSIPPSCFGHHELYPVVLINSWNLSGFVIGRVVAGRDRDLFDSSGWAANTSTLAIKGRGEKLLTTEKKLLIHQEMVTILRRVGDREHCKVMSTVDEKWGQWLRAALAGLRQKPVISVSVNSLG